MSNLITNFFINQGFNFVESVFALLPDITWDVNTTAWQYLGNFLDMIGYLLPMGTISTVVSLIFATGVFRICISFARTLMDLIPFV